MSKGKNSKKKTKRQSPKIIFWIVGLLAICMGGLLFLSNTTSKVEAIDYNKQPFLGEELAPVQIVEFGDYKCPICKNFNESFLPQIQKDFINTGKARFYFMNYSFINVDSIRSAKFGEAVYKELGNETFWEFHELLFNKQPNDLKYERMDIFTEEFLEDALKEIVSEEEAQKVVKTFHNKESESAWDNDMKEASKLEITGTPTLFVNGKKFEGNSYEDFKEMVENAAKGE
ncbi:MULTISPECIES: DsbA family protein [Metabacillus]|uniref:Thiol-disulfide oxidoreductase n=2 Tax=Metabacillus TaxID=2675233 RepID=A0A179SNN0_9BACI|nr:MULTISPECIES: DsbA family protein [Metabacillus]OAS82539.1 thiol-disulfide oxidoreductase [Metabacillus litoralis]QNF26727.1 DsbA family protein [Metabacillus sp. KUDC1714]